MDRIPRPEPDPEDLGHYKNVFQTLGINGGQRQVDDFLPRANYEMRNHSAISANSAITSLKQ